MPRLDFFFSFYISKGTGDGNLTEAEALLKPYTKRFPNVGIYFFFSVLILISYNCILMPEKVLCCIILCVFCP